MAYGIKLPALVAVALLLTGFATAGATVSDESAASIGVTPAKRAALAENESTNEPPTAEANGPYEVGEGGTVSLFSQGSSDPDGAVDSTSWWVADGPGSISDGEYEAPSSVSNGTTVTVELTVRDDDGAAATDRATILIDNDNAAPTVVLPDNVTVSTGAVVTLAADRVRDPDGYVTTTRWELLDGVGTLSGDTYRAPSAVTDGDAATVQFTASDRRGETTRRNLTVRVEDSNLPPTADAGGNYTTTAGDAVRLNATASTDPDSRLRRLSWTVVDGPGAVSLGRYQPPSEVNTTTRVTVRLTAVDTAGARDNATATVVVEPDPSPEVTDGGTETPTAAPSPEVTDGGTETPTATPSPEVTDSGTETPTATPSPGRITVTASRTATDTARTGLTSTDTTDGSGSGSSGPAMLVVAVTFVTAVALAFVAGRRSA
ncbi:PKD domain-containing protein [Haloarcula sp. S1CR25-12]|uniref:PKD domain-containing protein n=1 Tax=Haloarcula saliterrae TaxID=2950534 RepID=A0ABU2FCH6_9EURY|nr:PKD domain-containing protein [Haloarcula sp. S1CR25-12]MDS0259958.1 PKD domain-containing protein [Haloarcula sp. S1CR25-12]